MKLAKVPPTAIVFGLQSKEDLGCLLKARRAQLAHATKDGLRKFRADAMARRLKVSADTIHHVEAGTRWMTWEMLNKILKGLNMQLAVVVKPGSPDLGNL